MENQNSDKKTSLDLAKFNYEKLHEIHQSEIKSAWSATGLFLSATFAAVGYVVATKNNTGISTNLIFLTFAFVMLIHNLLGERLSFLNERRKEQLEELEDYFSTVTNGLPKFLNYGINFEAPGKKKGPLRWVGRKEKIRWVYWLVFCVFVLLAVAPIRHCILRILS